MTTFQHQDAVIMQYTGIDLKCNYAAYRKPDNFLTLI